ncbi:DDE-type integrase/transposase/recombinase [Ralstonia pseudosolanacearum]|uniref:integrase catalytic domain-containing protein n=1 Tax=Ralstonia pseudosolanacearum TaxID=1310165 RepID=UPI0026752959|nr:transposase family protein [Ralstonia pseudosolanacearum]MDO3529440.1 transposase family protein [Ralstonia pseudosolanacearum]
MKLAPVQTAFRPKWLAMESAWSDGNPFGREVLPPYSDVELEDLFEEWGTPSLGRAFVRRARRDGPVREVNSHRGNVVSRYTPRKMNGRRQATESLGPEYAAVIRYDLDNFTREFYCQPGTVSVKIQVERQAKGGEKRFATQSVECTPDILCITQNGLFIDEWKTEHDLLKLLEKYPYRFQKNGDDWLCPEREAYFRDNLGITYRLRSSAEHNPRFVANLEFLRDYLSGVSTPLTGAAWAAMSPVLEAEGRISLRALLERAQPQLTPWDFSCIDETTVDGFTVDDIYKAIAEQRVFVDLFYDDLSDSHETVICSSREQLEWVRASRPVPHAISEDIAFNLCEGASFIRGTEICTVKKVGNEHLYFANESGDESRMPLALFEKMLEQRDVQILRPPQSTEERLAQLENPGDARISKALQRFQLVEASKLGKPKHQYHVRTLQRYRRTAREAGPAYWHQLHALTPKEPSGGRCQISALALELIREVARQANTPENPLDANAYRRYEKLSEERGVPAVSRKTFYHHHAAEKDVLQRQGSRVAYNEEPAIWYLCREDKIHGGRPFHMVHIDHTQLDIFIKIRGYGGRWHTYRPWLTVAIDAETRAVVGFYLSIHSPSTVSCMMVVRDMVFRHKRMPEIILVDNGKDFRAAAFEMLCAKARTTLRFRPPHKSRFGSVCERLFGTTNTLLIHNLVGNTKALQKIRTVTRSVDPVRSDHLGFPQIHGILEYFFFDQYNKRIHPAHDHTPDEYMRRRFAETGLRFERMVPFDQRFLIETCVPPARGLTRDIDRQMGIKIGHIHYWADVFADPRLRVKTVEVRIDMWDVSIVWASINNGWVKCVSRLLVQLRRLTSIELRYALDYVRKRLGSSRRNPTEKEIIASTVDYLEHLGLGAVGEATASTAETYAAKGMAATTTRTETTVPLLPAPTMLPAPVVTKDASDFQYGSRGLLEQL